MENRTSVDPMRSLEVMAKTGPLLAQAKAHRIQIEEYRKTLKAMLMRQADKDGFHAAAAQEREAYADQSYADHLLALEAAVEAEETLRWRMATAQAAIDVWRSLESSNRMMDRGAA